MRPPRLPWLGPDRRSVVPPHPIDGPAAGVAIHTGREIEFAAFAEDCRIFAFMHLVGERMSDALNAADRYRLHDVMVVALDDGRTSELPNLVLQRGDLRAVRAAGARGDAARRTRTRAMPITVKSGPYTIHGYVHGPPAGDPLLQLRRRRALVPLTEAWIEYAAIGCAHRARVGTIIVNHECADWIANAKDDEIAMPDLPLDAKPDPLAKDLTGLIRLEGPPVAEL